MSLEYQNTDKKLIDYNLFEFENLHLRGPKPKLEKGSYFTCIGSAHTFGRYVEKPYPTLLAEKLGIEVLNIGVGGIGPHFFKKPSLLELINNSRFVVVQTLSGRSTSNTAFDSKRGVGLTVKIEELSFQSTEDKSSILSRKENRDFLQSTPEESLQIPVGVRLHATKAYESLLKGRDKVFCDAIRQETKLRYTLAMIQLLSQIEVPKCLLYFSVREPSSLSNRYKSWKDYLGEFPQFVDREVMKNIKLYSDRYVECVSTRGFPHELPIPLTVSSPSGRSRDIKFDNYYPSPEMHEDAFLALLKVIHNSNFI